MLPGPEVCPIPSAPLLWLQECIDMIQKAREDNTYVLPPSFLNAVIKFLKDNDISCEVKEGTVHSTLVKEISREDSEFLRLVQGK